MYAARMRRVWCPLLLVAGCYYKTEPRFTDPADAAMDAPNGCLTDPLTDAGPWIATEVQGINSDPGMEDDPSCTCDLNTIVFASTRGSSSTAPRSKLFIARRGNFNEHFSVTELTELNSASDHTGSPEINANGDTIYFTAGNSVISAVYVSRQDKQDGSWTIPAVASSGMPDPEDVAISPDGQTAMVAQEGGMYLQTGVSDHVEFTDAHPVPILIPGDSAPNIAAPSIMNNAAVVYLHAGLSSSRRIYRFDGRSPMAQQVNELNAMGTRNSAPFVLPGERYMLFARDHKIYEARR